MTEEAEMRRAETVKRLENCILSVVGDLLGLVY